MIDSALALALVETVDLLTARVAALQDALTRLRDRFGAVGMPNGRTRTRMPCRSGRNAHRHVGVHVMPTGRALRSRATVIQVGGPVGDRREIGGAGRGRPQLGLCPGPLAQRDTVAEAGAIFAGLAGSCGKIGRDMALVAQDGTLALKGGGGSSAMPYKQNPVEAGFWSPSPVSPYPDRRLTSALVHEQERSARPGRWNG